MDAHGCPIEEAGRRCGLEPSPLGGLGLCGDHLLAAYEAVLGEVGVTDALPGPCAACGSRLGVRWPSGWLCAVCEWRYGELPDTETAPPRVDVVYYIRFADRVKIGTSSTPRTRLAQLRHEEVLAFEPGARDVEQSRHQQFADLRLGGEWFSLEGDLAEHIAALALAGDPWLLHARWRSELAARR
ncbi:hypothetical protein GCM10010988_27680 [Cnuibacter physcomitrellae]|uniref:ATPase n=1 Tax=Cnuibacter physcomitrellae TaxID=1619308 RepID=A0A1X9LFU3_9MICO|nr:GIY-YIG nuclease family protein [Cnuibacter physcomitrellae]ARJ04065.1 ATPase [Cnuibacter physcomitrellae]GGI40158.1 hypothetical protein GCM10010988_27680 [Cnuibacter physcomitrellae]